VVLLVCSASDALTLADFYLMPSNCKFSFAPEAKTMYPKDRQRLRNRSGEAGFEPA